MPITVSTISIVTPSMKSASVYCTAPTEEEPVISNNDLRDKNAPKIDDKDRQQNSHFMVQLLKVRKRMRTGASHSTPSKGTSRPGLIQTRESQTEPLRRGFSFGFNTNPIANQSLPTQRWYRPIELYSL